MQHSFQVLHLVKGPLIVFLVSGGFKGGACAVDCGQDGFCVFNPGKRFGVDIAAVDPVHDLVFEVGYRVEGLIADDLVSQDAEESFDLVKP